MMPPDDEADPRPFGGEGFSPDQLMRQTAPPELEDAENRRRWRLEEGPEGRGPYLVEINALHVDGLAGATAAFRTMFDEVLGTGPAGPPPPSRVSKGYLRCELRLAEWRRLLAEDERRSAGPHDGSGETGGRDDVGHRTIYRLWPDFPVRAHVARSVSTIKADAALRSFAADGTGIAWAVIDSGVAAEHPHFGGAEGHLLHDASVERLHRCFVEVDGVRLPDPDEPDSDGGSAGDSVRRRRLEAHRRHALSDDLGHGTHVAGIISGRASVAAPAVVLERRDRLGSGQADENNPQRERATDVRPVGESERDRIHGVAPGCRLVSLRVLDAAGEGRSSDIIRALEYVREELNDNPKVMRVHGVNLSVGYDFDAEMFACGQSPLCAEVNRLVRSGVVVVAAAGNTGYTTIPTSARVTKVGLSNTINDPGNADLAITVGATHRNAPHTYGVSYFSSKGPTADGRAKPDLVAPGERIVSCAWGRLRERALSAAPDGEAAAGADPAEPATAYYAEDSGTSMAAPHVSGAVAGFLSIRQEFVGRPEEVKRIFLDSATSLGRERYFEGHGLVDLMRAIQSV